MRLKACAYCGRVHAEDYDCGHKPVRRAKNPEAPAVKLRSTSRWQRKREEIKQRDHYLCQLCLRDYPGTLRRYEYEHLSVHHIVSIEEDETKAFDNDNLITLCDRHHEAAEAGIIPRPDLLRIAAENDPHRAGVS